jgi:predicted enzyme related to lactoylglutathione lyase
MAQIINSRYVLAVRNLEVSTKYYTHVLGFRTDPIDAFGWSFLSRDCIRLMLGECADTKPAAELEDHSWFAYWNVEGVDDLYEEFLSKGALLTSAPTTKPWGLREFGLSTPDGHRIVCGQTV